MGNLLLAILGKVVEALVGGLVDWAREKRAEQAAREVGRLEQKVADQEAALAAQKRVEDANAKPFDAGKQLDAGKF
jgi:hypothetical protein